MGVARGAIRKQADRTSKPYGNKPQAVFFFSVASPPVPASRFLFESLSWLPSVLDTAVKVSLLSSIFLSVVAIVQCLLWVWSCV